VKGGGKKREPLGRWTRPEEQDPPQVMGFEAERRGPERRLTTALEVR